MGKGYLAVFILLLVAMAQQSPGQGVAYSSGFVPALHTVFSDNFARYKNGPFASEKWQVVGDASCCARITDSMGTPVLTIWGGKEHSMSPKIPAGSVTGKYVTFECDFLLIDTSKTTISLNFVDAVGTSHYFTIDRQWLIQYTPGDNSNGGNYSIPVRNAPGAPRFDPSQRHCLAISFSEEYLIVYLDGYQVWGLGSNMAEMVEDWGDDTVIAHRVGLYDGYKPAMFYIHSKWPLAIRDVRLAQSDEVPHRVTVRMAAFDKILEGAPLATHNILFEVNKADIQAESDTYLSTLAKWLQEHAAVKLEISGHTDSDGDDAANLKLSQQRAQAIVGRLVSLGVNASRVKALGFGESKPMRPNDTPAGKAANRRVEFRKM